MWQLQLNVSEGAQLVCLICVSATSAFGAHGLKNDCIDLTMGRGRVAGKKIRARVLTEAQLPAFDSESCHP